jgi:Peptidase family S41
MRKLLLVVFLLITFNLIGQETKFSKQDLKVDLDSLVSYIEQVHLNPYTCISKKKFYRNIELCKKNLSDSTSIIKYFTLISPILSNLNDGHTGVAFPYTEWKNINPFCFPFKPKISMEGKLFAPENQTELPKNAEIVSINGIPSKQIVDKLVGSISGESKNFRLSCLKNSFLERFGAFYGYKTSYLISYKFGKDKVSATISGIKLSDLLASIKIKRLTTKNNNSSRFYEYKTLSDGKTGIIDFKHFEDLDMFTHFLDTVFTQIKQDQTENLIIDLRNNDGGYSALGDELFQYISKVPFAQFGKEIVKYSKIRSQSYMDIRNTGFMKSWTDSAYNRYVAPKYGTIETSFEKLRGLRENPLRFNGNVYILTSSQTFSSASDFAWCFQYFNMGKVIGEETGGYIVCFGDLINTTLPVTKLPLFISHREFYGYGATEKERHGVLPDYKVDADNALDFTLKLIDKVPSP